MNCRHMMVAMTSSETPAQILGRLVRSRRERLGLKQEDLALYGGPGVTTVGKIERAAQDSWAVRTRHQVENALGWPRGAMRNILLAPTESWWQDEAQRVDYEQSMIEDDLPDLSRTVADAPALASLAGVDDDELLTELVYRVRRMKARLAELEAAGQEGE